MASNRLAHALRKSYAMGPSVRNLLSQHKLDPSQIESSGPHQTLLKSDVLSFLNRRSNPKVTVNVAADEMRAHASLSAAKPPTASGANNLELSRAYQTSYISHLAKSKYARRKLDQFEIDVINSGGLVEKPEPQKQALKVTRR